MNRKPKNGPKDRVVCFCYNVNESTIIEAIRAGCKSLMDIRRQTYASTGCAGCSEEVKKLLRKYAIRNEEPSGSDSGSGAGSSGSPGPKVSNG